MAVARAGRRRSPAPAASPGPGRLRAGRLQTGLRAGLRIRDPGGWRRPARRARHPAHSRAAEDLGLRDGDRLALRRRERHRTTGRVRGAGHPVLPHGAAAHSGQAGARPHFRFRGREPQRAGRFQPQLSRWNIRKSKRWWCCSAAASASRKCPCKMRPRVTGRSSITAAQIALLHCARAAGRVRERAEVSTAAPRPGARQAGRQRRKDRGRNDGSPFECHHRF